MGTPSDRPREPDRPVTAGTADHSRFGDEHADGRPANLERDRQAKEVDLPETATPGLGDGAGEPDTKGAGDRHATDHGEAATRADGVQPAAPGVIVDEPPPPRRIRQPVDLARIVLCVAGLVIVALIAEFAVRTAGGLESDVGARRSDVPAWITNTLTLLVAIALLALPIVVLLDQLLRGRLAWITDLVTAGLLGCGVAIGLNWLLRHYGSIDIYQSLTVGRPTGGRTAPIPVLLCALAAFTSAAVYGGRRWVRLAIWVTIGGLAAVSLLDREAGVLGVIATLLLGRTIGLAVRYAFGTPNTHPHGADLVRALREAGLDPVHIKAEPSRDQSRRYLVTSRPTPELDDASVPSRARREGAADPVVEARDTAGAESTLGLEVRILDRDQRAAGLLSWLYRQLRVRSPVTRRATVTFRASVERDVLMSQAAFAAGVRTPKLVVAASAGPDTAILAYQHIAGRVLGTLATPEIDDVLLRDVCAQLAAARTRHVMVRGFGAGEILVDDQRRSWLLGVGSGEVAASRLQLRYDVARLLTTLALLVGSQRAAAAAIDTLGAEAVTAAVPLLQPIAMNRDTRQALRSHRTLLAELRDAITRKVPTAKLEPVQIERLRPRTIVSIVGAAFAAYYLLSALGRVNLGQLAGSAQPGWITVTLAFTLLSYVGATMSIIGFAPIRLPVIRTFLAQLASSFVKVITPAGVGLVALNARFVQRAGVEPALAVASVGLSQVAGFGIHFSLLVLFGFITGTSTNAESRLIPSQAVFIGAAAAALVILAAFSIPSVRRSAWRRIQPLLRRIGPRLLDMLQSPVKLMLGLGGNLVITLSLTAALYASVRALDGSITFTSLAVVYLAGAAIGQVAPTPGGLGAIEAALAAGLTAAGLPGGTAVSAVLLFRAMTFWLPIIPGWFAFHLLQRARAI